MSTSLSDSSDPSAQRILAFGAHPDDLEFGIGGVLLSAAAAGSQLHLVLASLGEAGTNGAPEERRSEAQKAAGQLGARLSWIGLGGDAHMTTNVAHALAVARVIREAKPHLVLAPTTIREQHPDHVVVGELVRDALRLARYGKVGELLDLQPWSVSRFYQYAISPSAEPADCARLVIDVSEWEEAWIELMRCHASQMKTRRYVDLQLARARAWGLQCGLELAQVLYTVNPLVFAEPAELPVTSHLF